MEGNFKVAPIDSVPTVPSDELDVSDLIEMALGRGRSQHPIEAGIHNEANKQGNTGLEEASGLSQVATGEGQSCQPNASDSKTLAKCWNYQASQRTEGGSDNLVACREGSSVAASRQIELEDHVGLSQVATEGDGQHYRPSSSKLLTVDECWKDPTGSGSKTLEERWNYQPSQRTEGGSDDLVTCREGSSVAASKQIELGGHAGLRDSSLDSATSKEVSNGHEESPYMSQVATEEEGQSYPVASSKLITVDERWRDQGTSVPNVNPCVKSNNDSVTRGEHNFVALHPTGREGRVKSDHLEASLTDAGMHTATCSKEGSSGHTYVNTSNGLSDVVHRSAQNMGENSAPSKIQSNHIASYNHVKADECWDGDNISDSASQVMEQCNPQAESSQSSMRCSECNFVAFQQIELEEHVKSDHPEVLLNPQCSSSSRINDLTERFPCVECSYTTDDKSVLQHHVDTKHLGIKCAPDCNMCTWTSNGERKVDMRGRPLTCPHCDYVGPKRRNLLQHMKQVHSDTKQFKCSSCSYETNNGSHLKLHISAVHLKKRDFGCQLCSFTATMKCNLTKHINRVHNMLKDFSCPNCDYKALMRHQILSHIKMHHAEQREFNCDQCEYGTIDEIRLKAHIKAVHLKLKRFSCTECTYQTYDKSTLVSHVDRVHKKITNYSCSECNYKVYSKERLIRHVRFVHKKEKAFTCTECDYKSSTKVQLTKHMNSIHLQLKPFACDECDFRTAEKKTLLLHIKKIHLKVRDNPCDQCDYTASTMSDVLTHKRSVHAEKNLACPDCDYKTADNRALRNHIKRVPLKLMSFKCKQCSFSTAYQSSLGMHNKLVHNKGQPFRCNECSFKSFKKYQLEAHVDSVHNGAGPVFTCKECGLAAATEHFIKLHVGQAHNRGKKGNRKQPKRMQSPSDAKHNSEGKPYSCSECSFGASRKSALKAHISTAHQNANDNDEDGDEDMDITISYVFITSQSLYRSRRSYHCQECENPDVPKSPFPKHIIISVGRIDCSNDLSGEAELNETTGQLSPKPLDSSLKTNISKAADLEFNGELSSSEFPMSAAISLGSHTDGSGKDTVSGSQAIEEGSSSSAPSLVVIPLMGRLK